MFNSVHSAEALLVAVLLQLIVVVGVARLMNAAARALGQPGATGEIVAGLMLGPSLFGAVAPGLSAAVFPPVAAPVIGVISQIGLLLLMFGIGTDFEFHLLAEARRARSLLRVAAASIAVPLGLGVGFGAVSGPHLAPGVDPLAYSLFCGVAMAITAVPILGRILREFGLAETPVGVLAIAAAAVNDVVGWLLLAGIAAFAAQHLSPGLMGLRVLLLAVGAAGLLVLGRPLVGFLLRRFPPRDGRLPPALMAAVLCLTFALGIGTEAAGIFTIFGGFVAGLLFHRHAEFVRAWRHQVGQFVLVFFLPVFFTFTGLRTNLLGLGSAEDVLWLCLVLLLAVGGKVVPVYWAGRRSGFGQTEALVLGSLMNTRALMELIVLNVGFELGVLPQRVFTMLVIMAVVTTLMTGPALQRLLPRMGHRAARVQA